LDSVIYILFKVLIVFDTIIGFEGHFV